MLSILKPLARFTRRFGRKEDGVMAAEVILTFPVFAFCIIGMYTYWDAFRSLNTAQKASYAISDMITREGRPVNDAYLQGLHDVLQYMVGPDLPVRVRFTSITFSGVRDRYEVVWSRSPLNEMAEHTTDSIAGIRDDIPILADGDSIVLVETQVDFTPAFGETPAYFMKVGQQEFENFIVTRPRFVPRICLEDVYCG